MLALHAVPTQCARSAPSWPYSTLSPCFWVQRGSRINRFEDVFKPCRVRKWILCCTPFEWTFSQVPFGVTANAALDGVRFRQPFNTLTMWGLVVVKPRMNLIPGLFLSTFKQFMPAWHGSRTLKVEQKAQPCMVRKSSVQRCSLQSGAHTYSTLSPCFWLQQGSRINRFEDVFKPCRVRKWILCCTAFELTFSQVPFGVTANAALDGVRFRQHFNTLAMWGLVVVKPRRHLIPGLFLSTFKQFMPAWHGPRTLKVEQKKQPCMVQKSSVQRCSLQSGAHTYSTLSPCFWVQRGSRINRFEDVFKPCRVRKWILC